MKRQRDPVPCVEKAVPLDGYVLKLTFKDGAIRTYDFAGVIERMKIFAPLKDKAVFDSVYVQYGAPLWLDGSIDYDPCGLYEDGIPVEE